MSTSLLETRTPTRITTRWYGSYRKVEQEHQLQISASVHADPSSIRTTKNIFNAKLEPLAQINRLRTSIREYWESVTTPYPEPGIRLLLKTEVESFTAKMQEFQHTLFSLANDVQTHRDDIISDAIVRLGNLFNSNNYPDDLASLFGLEYSFPSIMPPADLPYEVFRQQHKAAMAKLQEAVSLAEEAFTAQLSTLVSTLSDRLQPNPDGTKKVFHESTLANLQEFFDRFAKLNTGTNTALDEVVDQARLLLLGVSSKELRSLPEMRKQIAAGLETVTLQLQPLIVNAPRRKLLRMKPYATPLPTAPQASTPAAASF